MASIHGAAASLMLATCSTTMHHNPKKCRAFWCFDPGIHSLHQRCMGKGLFQRISLWTPKTKLLHRCWRLLESWQPPDRMISWSERFNMFFSVLLLRSVIFLGSIVGFCFGSFFLQAKIRTHIDNKILPALASVAAKQFGREVQLGNVEKVSPLGITLGPCSVGTHRGEFSCAELPKVEIRLRPFRSIKRGTIVVDVILSHPNILVCQKRDWSWLGIPNPSEKQHVLQSTDHNIDTRTKIRRVSRESHAAKFAEKRDAAAKLYSQTGYNSSQPDPPFKSTNLQEEVGKLDSQMDERNKVREGELLSYLDISSSNSNSYLEATGTGPEMKLDTAEAKFHDRSIRKTLLEAKRWLTRRAHKYRMFAVWNNKDPPATKKEMYQRRNLDRAAIAAAASFAHEENSVNATDGFKSQDFEYDLTKTQEKNDKVTCPPLINHNVHELNSLAAAKAAISAAAGQVEDYKQYLAITHQAIISSSNAIPHITTYQGTHGYQETGSTIGEQIKEAERMAEHVKARAESGILEKSFPISLESVHFTCGTLTLLAYGDHEPRMLEEVDGWLKFEKTYENINVQVTGKTRGIPEKEISHGIVAVKAVVDIGQQKWHVKVKVQSLSAPLFNRLLEIPLDCAIGQADGEVHIWMEKSDHFPNFGGKIDLKDLQFQIWEAPSAFKNVHGTLFFQGQRIFLHNTKGFYGYIPINVSGDMDLNPENGEYRLSCQVPEAEVNLMMKSLNIRPPPFSVAGNLKAVVYCRGPLDAPIFEGSVETPRCPYKILPRFGYSPAYIALESNYGKGAVAAYDRIAFSYVSANFTFDTDNCVANLYGIRVNPVSGGEIRGAGEMWVCPEGEMDPTAVRVDCSGHVFLETILQDYVSATVELPAILLGAVHGEAKIRGSLLQPIFDIGWAMPEAKGTFSGAHGDIRVSYNAIFINAAASTFDLAIKVETAYPAAKDQTGTSANHSPFPKFGGLDVDVRLRGFDIMGFVFPDSVSEVLHAKLTGKLKFQGHVTEPLTDQVEDMETTQHGTNESMEYGTPTISGEVQLSGIKLNQLFIAHQFAGSLELSQSIFKIHTAGRLDDHLIAQFSTEHIQVPIKDRLKGRLDVSGLYVSLQRGQLLVDLEYVPQNSAILQIRNLLIDELELASLRGFLQKVDIRLNLQKRRGSGSLSLRRPRFSGVHGESLDISARWSGDVITLEKSILEQSSSRYELQGEYVFPGPRDWVSMSTEKGTSDEGMWMAGELGRIITSLGRWRLRLEVPGAQVAEMLPLARLLSRSSDPAVVSRSKALFLQGVEKAAFISDNLYKQIEFMEVSKYKDVPGENLLDSPLPGLAELNGHWHATIDASGGGNSDTRADFDIHGEDWEWGAYRTQKVVAVGGYCNSDGFRLEKFFIQKDTATLHADGTLLGPTSNLHFAVLNFPVGLVPRLLHAFQESSLQRRPSSTIPSHIPVSGILHMEGDLRGNVENPQCEVQVRLLDGIIGGVNLGRAEMAASVTAENQFFFNAVLEPVTQAGHVYVKGNIPLGHSETEKVTEMKQDGYRKETNQGNAYKDDSLKKDKQDLDLRDAFKEWEVMDTGELSIDAAVKDGGMMLLAAVTPDLDWIQGNADIKLQVRGTKLLPKADGTAVFHKVAISSPVLPRPISNLGGRVVIRENELFVEEVEGRVGRRGNLQLKGSLTILPSEKASSESIEIKAETLVVRAKNTFSGQVDCHMRIMHSLLEPEVTGIIKLSHGEAYLSQEKGPNVQMPSIPASTGRYSRIISNRSSGSNQRSGVINLPGKTMKKGMSEDGLYYDEPMSLPLSIRLKALKVYLGPELRVVYPLILNFAVNGELELSGFADPARIRPKGTLTFENGDVNLVATQVRLNKDYLNRARFEPEQGLDPTLDLALVGADWQLKVQGRARQWQDNLVMTSTRSGGQDAHAQFEAARVFESQLAESLLEGDGQIAFKKLAAATVETLMPKIETKGEFGQARWRLVYAPQIPNLLSIDPTTDPFKSLANLSFGTEVEVQLGKHLQASVVRQLRESEMATQWTLIYQLNNKLRILFSSIPSIDNRLLFEYSATS